MHRHVRADSDGVAQDARLVAFDQCHLSSLLLGGQVLVDDADAALLGDGDGQTRLGHRVHRSGHERQVQLDVA